MCAVWGSPVCCDHMPDGQWRVTLITTTDPRKGRFGMTPHRFTLALTGVAAAASLGLAGAGTAQAVPHDAPGVDAVDPASAWSQPSSQRDAECDKALEQLKQLSTLLPMASQISETVKTACAVKPSETPAASDTKESDLSQAECQKLVEQLTQSAGKIPAGITGPLKDSLSGLPAAPSQTGSQLDGLTKEFEGVFEQTDSTANGNWQCEVNSTSQ